MLETESFMDPFMSLQLNRCVVNYTPTSANDFVFEIRETVPLSGMSSLFKKQKETKITLRGSSQEQMVEWILKLELR
jgi:hypothetical protein